MTRSHQVSRGKAIAMAALVAVFAMAMLVVPSAGAKTAVIKMKLDNKGLRFKGADHVKKGQKLEIKNTTDPSQVGPHSFSLVKKKLLPETRKQQKHCFNKGHICREIAKAHKADFQTGTVKKPIVDKGKNGWDRRFSKQRFGDSWFSDEKGSTNTRVVKAGRGDTIWYMCLVHPEMQGKFKVK